MKAEIVQIGNSQGIRLPKAVLQQCGLEGSVELEVSADSITIRRISKPRVGWQKAFVKMRKQKDDQLIDQADSIVNKFDKDEWKW